jgi:hypothetical protein
MAIGITVAFPHPFPACVKTILFYNSAATTSKRALR